MGQKNKQTENTAGDQQSGDNNQQGLMNSDNMNQVRELLFGESYRQIDERIAQLQADVHERFQQLEDQFQRQLQNEHESREQAIAELERRLQQQAQDHENRISAVEDDFRSAMAEMDKDLRHVIDTLDQRHQQQQDHLTRDKVSRGQLADLLTGLAETIRPPVAADNDQSA
jgi:phage host-nuclease inhibitor protein Gam